MRTLILSMLTVLALTSIAMAQAPTDEQPAADAGLALVALASATAVAGVLLAETPSDVAGLADGCYVWQQPGVALVITDVWHPAAEKIELWLGDERLQSFLVAQQTLRWEAPFIYPREPEAGSDSVLIEPAVYLLDASQAAERLGRHLENLQTWIDFNPGMEFILPAPESARPEAAVVFIDTSGPIEFYFQSDQTGALRLTHLIHFDFFSA